MLVSNGGSLMTYTIRQLAALSGVSTRTLRYYDEIGLLKPAFVNDAGYRFYDAPQVDRLQQILFYRQRGFELKAIRRLMDDSRFDRLQALQEHLSALEEKRRQTDALIASVRRTIADMKGEIAMSDQEKFEALKQSAVADNEARYGQEARRKYGDQEIDASRQKLLSMTEEEWSSMQRLDSQIKALLKQAVQSGASPESDAARDVVRLHKAWLMNTWKTYTPKAHKGVAQLYTGDERFTRYYDEELPGCAAFLHKAIACWADRLTE